MVRTPIRHIKWFRFFSSLRILFKTSATSTSVAPFFVRCRTCAYIILLFLLRDGGATRISTIRWNNNNSYVPIYIYIYYALHTKWRTYICCSTATTIRPTDWQPTVPQLHARRTRTRTTLIACMCNRRRRPKICAPEPPLSIVLRKMTVLFVRFFYFKILSPFAYNDCIIYIVRAFISLQHIVSARVDFSRGYQSRHRTRTWRRGKRPLRDNTCHSRLLCVHYYVHDRL